MNQAAFHSADLFAAILVWGGIGWLLDRWLGTGPWLMLTGFLFGNGLGLYMAWLRGRDGGATKIADAPAGTEKEGVASAKQ